MLGPVQRLVDHVVWMITLPRHIKNLERDIDEIDARLSEFEVGHKNREVVRP